VSRDRRRPRRALRACSLLVLGVAVTALLAPHSAAAEGDTASLATRDGWDYFPPQSSALEPGAEPIDPCPAQGGKLHSTGDDAHGTPTISCETAATGAARAMTGFQAALDAHRAKKGEPSLKTWERLYAPFAKQVQCGLGSEVTFDGDRFTCLKTVPAKKACPDDWSDTEKRCQAKTKCPRGTRRVPAASGRVDEDHCVSCPTGAALATWQSAPACREPSTSARSVRRRAQVCSEGIQQFYEQQVNECGFLTAASRCPTDTVLSLCVDRFSGCGAKACRHQLNVFSAAFELKRGAR
jgi:hypothetical protein